MPTKRWEIRSKIEKGRASYDHAKKVVDGRFFEKQQQNMQTFPSKQTM